MCFSSINNSSGTIPQNNASVINIESQNCGGQQTPLTALSSAVVFGHNPKSDDADIFTNTNEHYLCGSSSPPKSQPFMTKRRKFQKPGFTAKNKVRHFVTHDYHDRSNITKKDILLAAKLKCSLSDLMIKHDSETLSQALNNIDNNDESLLLSKNKRRRGVKIPFPNKLYEIVEQAANQGFDDIISWCPHGRAFMVHDGKRFEEEVMPKYFKQTSKFTSFQRQLNLYGFLKLSRPEDFGAYYHEYFLRGRDFLCDFIERTKVKGIGYKGARDPKLEPNFYRMPFVHVNESEGKKQKVCCDDSNKVSVEPVNSHRRKGSESDSSCNPVMPPLDPCQYATGNVLGTAATCPISHLPKNIAQHTNAVRLRDQINSLLSTSKAVLSPPVNEYQQPAGININLNLTNIPYNGISQQNESMVSHTSPSLSTTPYYYEPYPHIPKNTMATLPTQTQEGLNKNDPHLEEFARLWFKN